MPLTLCCGGEATDAACDDEGLFKKPAKKEPMPLWSLISRTFDTSVCIVSINGLRDTQCEEGSGRLTLIRPHNNDSTSLGIDATVLVDMAVTGIVALVIDEGLVEICWQVR